MLLSIYENTDVSKGKHRFLAVKTVFSGTHTIFDAKAAPSAVDADDLVICHTATNLLPSRSPLNKGFFSDWWQYCRYFFKNFFLILGAFYISKSMNIQ